MEAELIYEHKSFYRNGDVSEITIWKVEKSKDKPYGYKYSLAYIREGKRIIGYDNAERKGDHRHYESREYPYIFEDVDQLFKDFYEDIRRFRDESKKRKA